MKLKNIALSLLLCLPVMAASTPPNIVFIFIDDMGYADIGPFGNTKLRTPHLDQLAKEGRKFTSYYATPVCTMSRSNLMTGTYNIRISVPGVFQPNSKNGLNPDEVILPEVMKEKGYVTACIGKWHLGDHLDFMPIKQGFDYYFGIPYSNNMIKGYQKNTAPPLPLYKGETIVETEPDQTQLTRRFTEDAIQFITANKDKPFFVYLPHPMIHVPLFASKDFAGKSAGGALGDAIEEIDWSVGQITATLKALNLEENTLVVFTSDNGPDRHPAPPLRGEKGSNLEGGVREPCIMKWPGKIPAGSTCDQIIGNIDMLPTFAKLIGVTPDPKRTLDGKDSSSLLLEENPSAVRDTQLYVDFRGGGLSAIRQGDWKLFVGATGENNFKNSKKGKGGSGEDDEAKLLLYNLKTDIGETTNVAAENPDIVARLKKEAEKRHAEIMKNRRPIGTLK
jgi:arylsulfatase A